MSWISFLLSDRVFRLLDEAIQSIFISTEISVTTYMSIYSVVEVHRFVSYFVKVLINVDEDNIKL